MNVKAQELFQKIREEGRNTQYDKNIAKCLLIDYGKCMPPWMGDGIIAGRNEGTKVLTLAHSHYLQLACKSQIWKWSSLAMGAPVLFGVFACHRCGTRPLFNYLLNFKS